MRELQIIYETPRGQKELSVKVAEEWNELSRKQLLSIMLVLSLTQHDLYQRRHHLLDILLQLPEVQFKALPAWVLYELQPLTGFLLEDEPAKPFTRQLLPKVRVWMGGTWLHGPADLLVNITFGEFITAEKHLFRFIRTNDADSLNCFVATLYRPERLFHSIRKRLGFYEGDNRSAFNEHLVEGRARYLAKLSEDEKAAILTWYRGCRSMLERLYPWVFSAEEEESGTSKVSSWEPVLRGMAGGKFGNVGATGRAQAHQILSEMNEQLQQAAEMKRKYKTTA